MKKPIQKTDYFELAFLDIAFSQLFFITQPSTFYYPT